MCRICEKGWWLVRVRGEKGRGRGRKGRGRVRDVLPQGHADVKGGWVRVHIVHEEEGGKKRDCLMR